MGKIKVPHTFTVLPLIKGTLNSLKIAEPSSERSAEQGTFGGSLPINQSSYGIHKWCLESKWTDYFFHIRCCEMSLMLNDLYTSFPPKYIVHTWKGMVTICIRARCSTNGTKMFASSVQICLGLNVAIQMDFHRNLHQSNLSWCQL